MRSGVEYAMRLRFNRPVNRRPVKPGTALVAVTGLFAFLGWSAYINFFAPPKPWPMDAKGRKNVAFFKAMAKKYDADLSKFTPEERARYMNITHGVGGTLPLKMAKEGKLDF
jgi:hypothetical protein